MGFEVTKKAIKKIEPFYIPLAKFALWATSAVLVSIVLLGGWAGYQNWRTSSGNMSADDLNNVVQACQVLAFITLAVLGYRGHKDE